MENVGANMKCRLIYFIMARVRVPTRFVFPGSRLLMYCTQDVYQIIQEKYLGMHVLISLSIHSDVVKPTDWYSTEKLHVIRNLEH